MNRSELQTTLGRRGEPMSGYLLRDKSGRILGGVGTDVGGRWTWWARVNGSRRVVAENEEAAMGALRSACLSADA